MSVRNALTGLIVLMMLVLDSPLSVAPRAQLSGGCNREIARQEAALRQFETDARRESLDFALDDARRAALGNIKERLAGDPTADAAQEIRERWDEWKEYMEQARTFEEIMADVRQCLDVSGGVTGCLKELIEKNRTSQELLARVSEATNKWIESLANDTLNNVKDRVEKARSIMQNFTSRAGNLATGSAARAVENCFREFEQRAQAQRDPVDLRSSQPSSPPNVPQPPAPRAPENTGGNAGNAGASGGGGGVGAGTVAGITAAGVGGGVGLWALNEYQKSVKCTQFETEMDGRMTTLTNAVNSLLQCGQSLSCFDARERTVNSAVSGILTTAGNWCSCLGPDAAAQLSPSDKAAVRDALNSLRGYGISTGNMPACFR